MLDAKGVAQGHPDVEVNSMHLYFRWETIETGKLPVVAPIELLEGK
jgi:hypothetical protein